MTPQQVDATMTDEQLSVLVPALSARRSQDSPAAIAAAMMGAGTGPARSGRQNPAPGSVRAGRSYGSPGQPLTGRDLTDAVALMALSGEVGRGRRRGPDA